MSRLFLLSFLWVSILVFVGETAFAEEVNSGLETSSKTEEVPGVFLTLKGINVASQTPLEGMANWKLINQDTNQVISLKGENSDTRIPIQTAKSNHAESTQVVTKGRWLINAINGEYTGLSIVDVGVENQLVEVNMHHKFVKVTINTPKEAIAGTILPISWEKPNNIDGKINFQKASEKALFYAPPNLYTKNQKESKANIYLPSEPGDYMLRFYNTRDTKEAIVEYRVTLKPADIEFTAPEVAIAGTEIDITWRAPKDSSAKINLNYPSVKPFYNSKFSVLTKGKEKGKLLLPSDEGDYVLRWFNAYDRQLVLERPIKILKEKIVITAPEVAKPGEKITISWEAPMRSSAKLVLSGIDDDPKARPMAVIYTQGKTEYALTLPNKEGEYIIRWKNFSDGKIMAEKTISVLNKSKELSAPDKKSFDI